MKIHLINATYNLHHVFASFFCIIFLKIALNNKTKSLIDTIASNNGYRWDYAICKLTLSLSYPKSRDAIASKNNVFNCYIVSIGRKYIQVDKKHWVLPNKYRLLKTARILHERTSVMKVAKIYICRDQP